MLKWNPNLAKVNYMFAVPASLALIVFIGSNVSSVLNDKPTDEPPLKVLTEKCAEHGGLVQYKEEPEKAQATCKDGTVYTITVERRNR